MGLAQISVARRLLRHMIRQPAAVAFSFVLPLVLLAVSTGGLGKAPLLRNFPADSFLEFAVASTIVQGALFAAITVGSGLARDLEGGMFDRLTITPASSAVIVGGYTLGIAAISSAQAILFVTVSLAAGASIQTGLLGLTALTLGAVVVGVVMSSIAMGLAVITRSEEAVLEGFPVVFILLYASSALLPRDMIDQDWFRFVADYNPCSYMIEALRSLIISDWNMLTLLVGCGAAGMLLSASAAVIYVVLTRRRAG